MDRNNPVLRMGASVAVIDEPLWMHERRNEGMQIVILDDDPRVRSALTLLMTQTVGGHVVASISGADELEKVLSGSNPDLLILDWTLDGIDYSPIWRQPNLCTIALSERAEHRADALAIGADAFVCKADGPEALVRAIEQLRESGRVTLKGHRAVA